MLDDWLPLTYALNAVNRSMGHDDLYPFTLAAPVIDKLDFVHRRVLAADQRRRSSARGADRRLTRAGSTPYGISGHAIGVIAYRQGLHELGNSLYAYLQPDGGWGRSNAGLVCDGEHSLLIDTLFDRRLTERMLGDMRRAVPAAARIDTLVNTHANGDHTYGNQLVAGARIVASGATAAEMSELPPSAFATLLEQAPNMGEVGAFFEPASAPLTSPGSSSRSPPRPSTAI